LSGQTHTPTQVLTFYRFIFFLETAEEGLPEYIRETKVCTDKQKGEKQKKSEQQEKHQGGWKAV
jgi:hypothetical protein